jgi:hypothetical protein
MSPVNEQQASCRRPTGRRKTILPLKCLLVIDLKIGKFTHADAGQMSLYLTYAKEHLAEPGENEPVGIILCSDKDDAVVHYSMGHMVSRSGCWNENITSKQTTEDIHKARFMLRLPFSYGPHQPGRRSFPKGFLRPHGSQGENSRIQLLSLVLR